MSETAPTKSALNRPWVLKMLIFIVVVLGFGSWGYYDAAIVYPARGQNYADWAEWQYLQASAQADQEDFGWFRTNASVTDPVGELEHLTSEEESARNLEAAGNPEARSYRRSTALVTRQRWLEGLRLIGQLKPERTTIIDPKKRLEDLRAEWASAPQPKPLHGFDIPMQWGIMAVCYTVGAYLIVLFLRVATKSYRWDPAEQRLTFPGGASLVPSDLAEIDKRKWDKFIVFLKVREGHDKLAGQEVRVDTYRHAHVEGWILEMERTQFPPQEEPETDADASDQAPPSADSGADTPDGPAAS